MKITPKQYARLIMDVVNNQSQAEINSRLAKVVEMIIKNGDARKTTKISEELELLYKEKEGVVEAEVTCARNLSSEQEEAIKEMLAKKNKIKADKIALFSKIDKNILGGLIIKSKNEIWDASVLGKIKQLKNHLF